jgi:caffeoyl-CoA O-methyltransferase
VYYDLVFDKVPIGGFILADNVLWSGKVVQAKVDKDTKAIKEFNQKVSQDTRVKTMLLPLRDGIMIVHKIKS